MKRLRLLGLSLLLLITMLVFIAPAYAEHPWTEEAPMYGKDEDMGGGKKGAQDVFNRFTRQDVFTNGNTINVITANINLWIIDWYVEHELVKAAATNDTDVSVTRILEARK
ncbi:MAG: hypothetical protein AB1483_04025 [Candidatus Zixiibacteriota bacterium]